MKGAWAIAVAALSLAGCLPLYPGPSTDYDVSFAKSYYSGTTLANPPRSPEELTLNQLYAAHRYGLNKRHPATSMSAEFARRGTRAAPYLKTKLLEQQSFGQVASILEAFKAMQEAGTFDVRADPALISLIRQSAADYPKDPYHTLQDMADELGSGTRIPTWFQPYWRKPFQGLGTDYDADFAKGHCQRCTYREYTADLDRLPLDKLYALLRYKGDKLSFQTIDQFMAKRGLGAIPFLKAKLAKPTSDVMVWNIMSTIELMQDLGTYDVAGDAELMRLAEAAVMQIAPDFGPLTVQLDRIKTGKTMRGKGEGKLPWMGTSA